jgi:putative spermidine/putrescine transport system permease protein
VAIDRSIEEGAASLGARPLRVFWSVTLPLSLPGVIAGGTLVFILTMGLYVTPVLMGGNLISTIAMEITNQARTLTNWPRAATMSVILLTSILGLIILSGFLQRLGRREP